MEAVNGVGYKRKLHLQFPPVVLPIWHIRMRFVKKTCLKKPP